MKPRRNPVYKWGMVNYECVDYEKCFDHAFRLHWEFWSCSKCPENVNQEPGRQYTDDKLIPQSDTHYS